MIKGCTFETIDVLQDEVGKSHPLTAIKYRVARVGITFLQMPHPIPYTLQVCFYRIEKNNFHRKSSFFIHFYNYTLSQSLKLRFKFIFQHAIL